MITKYTRLISVTQDWRLWQRHSSLSRHPWILGLLYSGLLVLPALVTTAANAQDRAAASISVNTNDAGRGELLVTTDNGWLFDLKQNDAHEKWNEWHDLLQQSPLTPSLLIPTGRRLTSVHSVLGGLYAFWLDHGSLRVARQSGDAAFFQSLRQDGSNFNSLAVAPDAANNFVVLTIAQDGTLWGTRQLGANSWTPMTHIGGHDLAGGGTAPSGPLGSFIVHPNALAAALGANGLISAFAVGGDGTLYFATQPDANSLPTVWSGLGGKDLADLSAFTLAGKATVIASDQNNQLTSRTQSGVKTWTPWQPVFSDPVTAWAAIPNSLGAGLAFAATSQDIAVQSLQPDGSWRVANSYYKVLGYPSGMIGPVRQISVVVGADHTMILTILDDAGILFSRPLTAASNVDGYEIPPQSWTRIGEVTTTPTAPDLAAQARGCLITQDEISDLQIAVTKDLTASGELTQGSAVNASMVCMPDGTAQALGFWLGRQPTPSLLPTDLIDLSPDAKPLESAAIRLTASGIQSFFDETWATFPKRLNAGDGYDIVLKSASLHYGKSDISIDLDGDFGLGKVPIPITATVKATLGISPDGRPTCVPTLTGSSQVLELGSNAFVPLAGYFGFSSLINSAVGENEQKAGVICDLVKAIPTEIMLPPVQGQSLKKMVFNYTRLQVDEAKGITYSMEIPPLPVDRQPRVGWYRVTGFAAGTSSTNLLLEFEAGSADMNIPTYSWSISGAPGGTKVIAVGNTPFAQVNVPHAHPLTVGQALGTLTVTVTDSDHSGAVAATYSAPIAVTSDMLRISAPADTNKIPRPLMPR